MWREKKQVFVPIKKPTLNDIYKRLNLLHNTSNGLFAKAKLKADYKTNKKLPSCCASWYIYEERSKRNCHFVTMTLFEEVFFCAVRYYRASR